MIRGVVDGGRFDRGDARALGFVASAVKARMRPLFLQERMAASAGLFLDGLLGGERRKTGWSRAEAAGDPVRGANRRSWAAGSGMPTPCW